MNEKQTSQDTYHKSVLTSEVLEYLDPQPGKLYLDATFGGGGHTKAILDAQPDCKVIALDWDKTAIEKNEPALKEKYGDRLTVLWGNFAHLDRILKKAKIDKFDGILADFGTSQFQIHHQPGFSFQKDTPLDMRMSASHYRVKASDLVNNMAEKELADLFFYYGEESRSRMIARKIVAERVKKRITTTKQLADLILSIIPYRKGRSIHPATKVFQALRIKVNNELDNIIAFLAQALARLNPEGRLACISFHSLEDRIVKQFFKKNKENLTILTPKPITATAEEIEQNPSSRSAKIRAIKK